MLGSFLNDTNEHKKHISGIREDFRVGERNVYRKILRKISARYFEVNTFNAEISSTIQTTQIKVNINILRVPI